MYFHCIPASVITSHGFAVILNLIITIAVAYVLNMGHSIPACRITGQAHPFPSP